MLRYHAEISPENSPEGNEKLNKISEYFRRYNERERILKEVLKERRSHLTRIVDEKSLQSLDDSMELATGVVGVLLLGIQVLFPESVPISNMFNLFVVGLIWILYRVAKIRRAIDLRLLIIAFSYQLFVVWILGLFVSIIIASIGMVILAALGLMPDVNVVLIFVFIMIFLITAGSRKSAKEFAYGKWLEILIEDYKTPSITQRYTDTALASVKSGLPHPFVAFILFFLVYWTGQPGLWISIQLEIWVVLLLFYTIHKAAVYLDTQQKENANW